VTEATAAPSPSRPLSAVEFLVGAAIVLGHNVWRVLPNEVPILFVIALVSARLREGGWAALGFRRPKSWWVVVALAIGAAILRLALGEFAIDPLAAQIWPPAKAPAGIETIAHDPIAALRWLGLIWTFAAVGEEVAYRGYLTKRAADVLGGGRIAWWAATLAASALFGLGHWYKGPAGVIDSGMAGLVLGATYLISGRCLWTTILAHGLIDSTGVILLFFGLAD
jgi:membrane protease YdiL (CAAX protease family)